MCHEVTDFLNGRQFSRVHSTQKQRIVVVRAFDNDMWNTDAFLQSPLLLLLLCLQGTFNVTTSSCRLHKP